MEMAERGVSPPPSLGQLSVLVIDPKSSSRAATTKLLEDSGYKVRKHMFFHSSSNFIYAGPLSVPLLP
jgi:hypothetical protein